MKLILIIIKNKNYKNFYQFKKFKMIKEKIDLIKIDINGLELQIVKSLMKQIKKINLCLLLK